MEKKPDNIHEILIEIFDGSTEAFSGGRHFFVKHPTVILDQLIKKEYDHWFNIARQKKLKTNSEIMQDAVKNKTWDAANDSRIDGLKFELDSLDKLKSKSARSLSLGDIQSSIDEKTKEFDALMSLKHSVTKNSAENFANKKAFHFKIYVYLYKDKLCSEKLLSLEEFKELEEAELFDLYIAYSQALDKFSANSLKWAAFSNDFLSIYSIYTPSIYEIFKCKPLELTIFQRETIMIARRIYSIINNGQYQVPEECFNHPDLILNYNPNEKVNAVSRNSKTHDLIEKAKKHGEFSAKDIDK